MRRWTWRTVHREVTDYALSNDNADLTLTLAFLKANDRTSLESLSVTMFELCGHLAQRAASTAEDAGNRGTKHPQGAAHYAADLRHLGELLAGVASVMERHADDLTERAEAPRADVLASPLAVIVGEVFDAARHSAPDVHAVLDAFVAGGRGIPELSDDGMRTYARECLDAAADLRAAGAAPTPVAIFSLVCMRQHPRKVAP